MRSAWQRRTLTSDCPERSTPASRTRSAVVFRPASCQIAPLRFAPSKSAPASRGKRLVTVSSPQVICQEVTSLTVSVVADKHPAKIFHSVGYLEGPRLGIEHSPGWRRGRSTLSFAPESGKEIHMYKSIIGSIQRLYVWIPSHRGASLTRNTPLHSTQGPSNLNQKSFLEDFVKFCR